MTIEEIKWISTYLRQTLEEITLGNTLYLHVWDADSDSGVTSSGACVQVKRGQCMLSIRFDHKGRHSAEVESPSTHSQYTLGETIQALSYLSRLLEKIEGILEDAREQAREARPPRPQQGAFF